MERFYNHFGTVSEDVFASNEILVKKMATKMALGGHTAFQEIVDDLNAFYSLSRSETFSKVLFEKYPSTSARGLKCPGAPPNAMKLLGEYFSYMRRVMLSKFPEVNADISDVYSTEEAKLEEFYSVNVTGYNAGALASKFGRDVFDTYIRFECDAFQTIYRNALFACAALMVIVLACKEAMEVIEPGGDGDYLKTAVKEILDKYESENQQASKGSSYPNYPNLTFVAGKFTQIQSAETAFATQWATLMEFGKSNAKAWSELATGLLTGGKASAVLALMGRVHVGDCVGRSGKRKDISSVELSRLKRART